MLITGPIKTPSSRQIHWTETSNTCRHSKSITSDLQPSVISSALLCPVLIVTITHLGKIEHFHLARRVGMVTVLE